ncbi:MAG: hypothetical protein F2520_08950 [Actinobacteria bacterium]|nr:hypothetical protein [Actinomycetota bacterium]
MGFLEPFPLLSATECDRVIRDARASAMAASWLKGLHEFDTACTQAALTPALVTLVSELLGDDVILWSTQLIDQSHGVRHRWHSDAEAMTWPTVDVWIGLRNVGSNSFLSVLERSHLWGLAPQEFTPTLDLLDDDAVRRAALEFDPESSRRDFPMEVGEVLVFDGRLWHASQTPGPDRRTALLLQYSPARAVPRVLKNAGSPPEWEQRRPGCVLVAGDGSTLDASNLLIRPRRLPRRRPGRRLLRLARRVASGLYRSAFQPGWRNR